MRFDGLVCSLVGCWKSLSINCRPPRRARVRSRVQARARVGVGGPRPWSRRGPSSFLESFDDTPNPCVGNAERDSNSDSDRANL